MPTIEELGSEIRVLRERFSRLSEASLRISESLDVDTVLHEVAERVRALTDAGCVFLATIDDAGQVQDFVTSGLSREEHRRLLELPYGPRLWEYLSRVPGPLRLRDLAAHLVPLGFPDDPTLARSFLGMPIRSRGVHVGAFYLWDKKVGREFTDEDEEVLALFASQAGGRHLQRAQLPGRTRGTDQAGSADQHIAGGHGDVRRPERAGGVHEP